MAPNSQIRINRRFLRSIRIDTDLNDPLALEGFICPQTSAEALLIMARHVSETGQGAFTWTGPYGSGKSSLVIALSALLKGDEGFKDKAEGVFGKELVRTITTSMQPGSRGWRILPIVGSRDDPVTVIGETARKLGFIQRRPRSGWSVKNLTSNLINAANFKSDVYGGLILFIDEMGKFLEAATQDKADIFFFQELAEVASRSYGRLLVIGVLHQAFSEYAHRLTYENRDEWSKIQGRYIDILVNTTSEEQIDLISRAIINNQRPKQPSDVATNVAKALQKGQTKGLGSLSKTLDSCWPLHPLVACLLGPISRRRFGQNQRSIFGFLNSSEPFGFQYFLKNKKKGQLYGPELLWDYLRANLEPSILSSPDGHRWALATEALERCESLGGDILHIKLLKTISIIDLFKERSGLTAKFDLLSDCLPEISKEVLQQALSQLDAWSFTIYKKFLDARSIFAGSDFNIDQAIQSALEDIGQIDFNELNFLAGIQPILAKRHYHNTGTLRWFDVEIVPLKGISEYAKLLQTKGGSVGYFVLVIPTEGESEDVTKSLCESVIQNNENIDILVGYSKRSRNVIPMVRELLAVDQVSNDHPQLVGDPVARREISARHATLQSLLETELRKFFDNSLWYRKNCKPLSLHHSQLNIIASEMVDNRYSKAPKLHNELLSRQKPSASAISAQNTLLRRMILNKGEHRLGIRNFPPEGGLFSSLLENTKLYIKDRGNWHFVSPSSKSDPCRLGPMWETASEYLKDNSTRNVAVSELFKIWGEPPFGVKPGLLPILVVAFILSQIDKLAIYRNGIFRARFDDVDVEYLAKDPSFIQIRWMDLNNFSRGLLSGMVQVVRDLDDDDNLTLQEPIDIGRGLVSIYTKLPNWTQRTMLLSSNARKIRELFKRANDPNRFLFDDIPKIFRDMDSFEKENRLNQVIFHVREGLEELIEAYPLMLQRLKDTMLTELQIPNSSSKSLEDLHQRANNILELTGDFRLNAFIGRLESFDGSSESFEEIASLAANKPPRDWTDQILDKVTVEIAELAQKFLRAELFSHVKGRTDKRQAIAVVVGLNKQSIPLIEEFSVSDSDRKPIKDLIQRFHDVIDSSEENQRIVLAALAEISTHFMQSSSNPDHSIEAVET